MGLHPGRISVLSVENPTIPTPVEGASISAGRPATADVEGPVIGWIVADEGPAVCCSVAVEEPTIGWAVVEAMTCTKLCIASISRRISAICCCISSQRGTSPSDETASSYGM